MFWDNVLDSKIFRPLKIEDAINIYEKNYSKSFKNYFWV